MFLYNSVNYTLLLILYFLYFKYTYGGCHKYYFFEGEVWVRLNARTSLLVFFLMLEDEDNGKCG